MIQELEILDVLRRRAWMIALLCVVATLVGYGTSFLVASKYSATALVLVRPQQDIKMDTRTSSKEFLDFPIGTSNIETPGKTYIEIIKSPALIGQLVRKLNLDKVEETKTGLVTRLMPDSLKPAFEELKQHVKDTVSYIVYGRVIQRDPFAEAVQAVQDSLTLEARPETYIFTIKFTAKDPELAAEVANSIAKSFIKFMEDLRLLEGQYSREQLGVEREKSRGGLERTRQNVEAFKKGHSLFKYETEYDAKLKVISELQSELAKLDESAAGLAAVSSQSLSTASVSLTAKRDSVVNQIRDRRAELQSLPELERQFKQLELSEKVALAAYEAVEKQFQEASIKNSYSKQEVQLVAEAVPPQLPSGLSRMIYALVALMSAFVIGVGLALLVEHLNRSVRSVRDLEDFVGLKVLATIPRVSLSGWRGANS